MTNLRYRIFDNFLICNITLVANKKLIDTFGSITVDLLQPLLDIVK